MDRHLLTPRIELRKLYYKSVVERDHRLQMIRDPILEDFENTVTLDKLVANGSEIIKSHPIAIYLNKSAFRLKKSGKMNPNLIYKQTACTNDAGTYLILEQADRMKAMDDMEIEPRKRWTKYYDRNPPFKAIQKLLSVEISNKITQLGTVQPEKEPVKYMNVDSLLRNIEAISRIPIYRRSQMKSQHEEGCSPLIWNVPDSSNAIDEVSGEYLSHITLLCRDVICECNKCTTGCTSGSMFSCEACKLDRFSEIAAELYHQNSGSFAEHCMLPTYYVETDGNTSLKKQSDIDVMIYKGYKVGFDMNESNIYATVDTEKSRPGYLKLRELGTGRLCSWTETSPHKEPNPSIKNKFFPSFDPRHLQYFPHGPATLINYDFADFNEIDSVPYLSCASWPPIATAWIDRERPSNWPSKEKIQTIVSKGCRVVHKPHELSKDKETEFRFSFSEAELILFGTLTCEQRKCFIAFKALVKYSIYKLEYKTKQDINYLSSYCLKTIFLWACETIPVDHWQTPNGWSKCLLYMIDNLYASVKDRNLPGYFIPESNLLDNMTQSGPLLAGIETLRSDPISHAAIFIDATKCFREFNSKMYDEINILCSTNKVGEIVLMKQLIFLQKLVARTNVIRGCYFWMKEVMLRIFAKWCKQNSNEIRLALWQCLTYDMTLFDVVYLDIVHGFDVPNEVLLKYVDKSWSTEFVCRLASCYNTYKQGEFRTHVEYSFLLKSFLMMQQALDRDNPTIEIISSCIYTLIKHKEFEMAILALESGAEEMLKCDESICLDDLDSVVGYKSKNELHEMNDIQDGCNQHMNCSGMSARVFFLYFSYVCCKNLGNRETLDRAVNIFLGASKIDPEYLNRLLMFEVFEHRNDLPTLDMLYAIYMSFKIRTIEIVADYFPGGNKARKGKELILPSLSFICSCSRMMRSSLGSYLDPPPIDRVQDAILEIQLARCTETTADRMYYAQALIFKKTNRKSNIHFEWHH